jgi:hypothetical protein
MYMYETVPPPDHRQRVAELGVVVPVGECGAVAVVGVQDDVLDKAQVPVPVAIAAAAAAVAVERSLRKAHLMDHGADAHPHCCCCCCCCCCYC